MLDKTYMKIAILGDSEVGKTALRELLFQKDKLLNGKTIHFYSYIYIDGNTFSMDQVLECVFGIIVFDVSRPDTFYNLNKWVDLIWEINVNGLIPLIIVGNKIDLRNSKKINDCISDKLCSTYCQSLMEKKRFLVDIKYFPFSVKKNNNANFILENMVEMYFANKTKRKTLYDDKIIYFLKEKIPELLDEIIDEYVSIDRLNDLLLESFDDESDDEDNYYQRFIDHSRIMILDYVRESKTFRYSKLIDSVSRITRGITTKDHILCNNCSEKIQADSKFCPNCGIKQE